METERRPVNLIHAGVRRQGMFVASLKTRVVQSALPPLEAEWRSSGGRTRSSSRAAIGSTMVRCHHMLGTWLRPRSEAARAMRRPLHALVSLRRPGRIGHRCDVLGARRQERRQRLLAVDGPRERQGIRAMRHGHGPPLQRQSAPSHVRNDGRSDSGGIGTRSPVWGSQLREPGAPRGCDASRERQAKGCCQ